LNEPPLTLTVEQAAAMLGVSRGVAYEAVRAGQIPSIRLGRRILVPRARLLELLGAIPEMREPGFDRAQGSRDTNNEQGTASI
jgi:excisionase family DNA binding protein